MIKDLLTWVGMPWTLLVPALVIFGFAPGLVLAMILRILPRDDPRRSELHAELYAVPRWERPFWVCEQFEVALREGVFPEMTWWWGRLVWHRSKLASGIESHRKSPKTFWIPSDDDKDLLEPGDVVKLMWLVRGLSGERMWVKITERSGDRFKGTLENFPVCVHMTPGETVKFHLDHIIDFELRDDETELAA